ncbi:hypothetical protein PIB30_095073 [Stylosanthes scabra]|uniref:Uncharacterized protein n=1 Tax=Stylosanthes scabra TaxID=79078 RepID=A0ABU6TYP0_9FABA|nr:hypothetical protein [Stylosanthes scabra]
MNEEGGNSNSKPNVPPLVSSVGKENGNQPLANGVAQPSNFVCGKSHIGVKKGECVDTGEIPVHGIKKVDASNEATEGWTKVTHRKSKTPYSVLMNEGPSSNQVNKPSSSGFARKPKQLVKQNSGRTNKSRLHVTGLFQNTQADNSTKQGKDVSDPLANSNGAKATNSIPSLQMPAKKNLHKRPRPPSLQNSPVEAGKDLTVKGSQSPNGQTHQDLAPQNPLGEQLQTITKSAKPPISTAMVPPSAVTDKNQPTATSSNLPGVLSHPLMISKGMSEATTVATNDEVKCYAQAQEQSQA